jgi:hypothetical protein
VLIKGLCRYFNGGIGGKFRSGYPIRNENGDTE